MWILTDDSSCQYVREVPGADNTFDLIEMSLIDPDTMEHEVYADTVCINDVDAEETQSILASFGHGGIDEVIERYGRNSAQIIAECIFEHYGSYRATRLFAGTEAQCVDFIWEYIQD